LPSRDEREFSVCKGALSSRNTCRAKAWPAHRARSRRHGGSSRVVVAPGRSTRSRRGVDVEAAARRAAERAVRCVRHRTQPRLCDRAPLHDQVLPLARPDPQFQRLAGRKSLRAGPSSRQKLPWPGDARDARSDRARDVLRDRLRGCEARGARAQRAEQLPRLDDGDLHPRARHQAAASPAARRSTAVAGPQAAESPSQQPSFNRQRGHCHVPWRHSISAPHRRHSSAGTGKA